LLLRRAASSRRALWQAMVGKKIAPIWVDEEGPMAESLDIIAKFDAGGQIAPASGRTDLKVPLLRESNR